MRYESTRFVFTRQARPGIRTRLPAIAALLILMALPSDGLDIPFCPLLYFADVPCPACGLTRSMSSFLHFDISKGLSYHPLGGLVLMCLLVVAITNRSTWPDSTFAQKYPMLAKLLDWKLAVGLFVFVWFLRFASGFSFHPY